MPPPAVPARDMAAVSNSKDDSFDISEAKHHLTSNNNNNNNSNNNNNNNENNSSGTNKNNTNNNNFSLLNKKTTVNDGKIYVNNNTDGMGKIWGNSESGAGSAGLVVHLSKLAYHASCYEKIRK
jgi:hypothetical protein